MPFKSVDTRRQFFRRQFPQTRFYFILWQILSVTSSNMYTTYFMNYTAHINNHANYCKIGAFWFSVYLRCTRAQVHSLNNGCSDLLLVLLWDSVTYCFGSRVYKRMSSCDAQLWHYDYFSSQNQCMWPDSILCLQLTMKNTIVKPFRIDIKYKHIVYYQFICVMHWNTSAYIWKFKNVPNT
jgi:hypothetical protein